MYGYSSQPMRHPGSTSAAQAQAQAEMEAARRRQEQMNYSASATAGVAPGMMKAELIVPPDAYPGKSIRIALQGREYMVTIPGNARPGQRIMIQVPVATPAIPVAVAAPPQRHHSHHSYSAPQPPMYQQPYPPAAPPDSYGSTPYAPVAQYAAAPPVPTTSAQYAGVPPVPTAGTYPVPSVSAPPPANPAYTSPPVSYPPPAASAPPSSAPQGYPSYASPAPQTPSYSAPPAFNPASSSSLVPSNGRLAHASSSAEAGRKVFTQAMSAQPTVPKQQQLVVITNHLISAEQRESYAEHNIISVSEGEVVTLVEGDLTNGLTAPYQDYVQVRTSDGREGKVAKVALQLLQ